MLKSQNFLTNFISEPFGVVSYVILPKYMEFATEDISEKNTFKGKSFHRRTKLSSNFSLGTFIDVI